MSNIVLHMSREIISKMRNDYQDFLLSKIPTGAVFTAKTNGCTITAYKSGKVLFQGANAMNESSRWGNSSPSPTKKRAVKSGTKIQLPDGFSTLSVMGSDEVGTGDYFGPMTVVSTYVKTEQMDILRDLGVRDSKHLNDDQIIKIAKELLHHIPYSLLVLRNEKYNKMQKAGMSQGKLKALLHNQALLNLLKKISPEKPDAILIDQFAEKTTYFRYLQNQKEVCRENVYFSTKGESVHLSVAAASILARYAFVKEFDKLSKEAGFTLPKGAGKQVDEAGARLILQKGEECLLKFTKHHFANTQKAKAIVRKIQGNL
ncbi:ribonuclease HIII [Oikeobacillus pervagus]|uniref:Ribonuclease HIII n=1 Tax=Oikeobacillus pervagus TaxID=1325931 RepID=A0AAJ1SZ32_9BACI|nr:ribonuclease HIII [Oikeobacillus pervagus]MDQ0215453.1 ribonuclease HIII [Oikeobacillus pervagus]